MGNSHWTDGTLYFRGHSNVVVDANGTITTPVITFGEAAWVGGTWINNGGTGELFINYGTVTADDMQGANVTPETDGMGVNISSAASAKLSLLNSLGVVNWWIGGGVIVADSGYGTVVVTDVGGRRVCTAQAYNPAVNHHPTYGGAWDAGGSTQSVIDHWNYTDNLLPWPGDNFVTTGMAPLGSHPIVDYNSVIGYVAIGFDTTPGTGTTPNDVIEIAAGHSLTVGGGNGGIRLGTALSGNSYATRSKGTLIVNGGSLICSDINNGGGDSLSYIYGEGLIEMNSGIIDCNVLVMSIPDTLYPTEPFGIGRLELNGGTINIRNTGAFIGADTSNGTHITDGTLIIEGDLDAIIGYYVSQNYITTDAGREIQHDYNVTNAGKTTVWAKQCPGGDVDGDCDVDIDDLRSMAGNWLDTAAGIPTVGDSIFIFSAGTVNPGLWSLGLNNNGVDGFYLPTGPSTGGYVFFNDGALTPNPNIPLVGDINRDGIADIVTVGSNTYQDLFFGRNTAVTGGAGDLLAAPVGDVGWPNNFVGTDIANTDFFIADVNGDGYADAVTRKPGTTTTSTWEARSSGSGGIDEVIDSWAVNVLAYNDNAIVGDFNGDGAVDIAGQNMSTGLIEGIVSTSGSGLNGANPTFWGSMGLQTNHIATLVGDIDGDGKDDIVQVDNRNSNGNWVWVTGLTGANGGIPAGIEIAQGGATSWVQPFNLDPNSTFAKPLLADVNNDGRDDLVLYEEYTSGGRTWSRLLASYTDGTGLFGNGYDEGAFYDWVTITGGGAYSNMIPLVGNAHLHSCNSLDGDLNSDCRVNLNDFAIMAGHWME
jgi:hypothetical protein